MVTGEQVAGFLGRGGETELVTLAGQHSTIITSLVRAYTRDRGFTGDEPAADLAAVIVTATARLVTAPDQVPNSAVGPFTRSGAGFTGWTTAELVVLNRYRQRAV